MLTQQLMELQETELALEQAQSRLRALRDLLGETDELQRARAATAAAQQEIEARHKRQRHLDEEIRSVSERIRSTEAHMLSGRVRNPKELEGLQSNVEALRRRRSELEDATLETMLTLDEWAATLNERQVVLSDVEQAWEEKQQELRVEEKQLVQQIKAANQRHTQLRSQLAADVAAEYDDLRRRKHGRAIAPLQRGACGGCGVDLPLSLQQAARQDSQLTYCNSCGRILHAG